MQSGNYLNVELVLLKGSADMKSIFSTLMTLVFLTACAPDPTKQPGYVPWGEAVKLIASKKVTVVAQAHSLDVMLEFEDGSSVYTVEPYIDAIYAELENCLKCDEILIATE